MSIWDGFAGEISGALLNQGLGYAFSAKGAKQAYERQKNMMIYGPGLRRQGWVNAGFNPILALGGQPNNASAVAAAKASPGPGLNPFRSGQETSAREKQERLFESQTELANVNARQAREQYEATRPFRAWLATPEGVEWQKNNYINSSTPQSLGAFGAKTLKEIQESVDLRENAATTLGPGGKANKALKDGPKVPGYGAPRIDSRREPGYK